MENEFDKAPENQDKQNTSEEQVSRTQYSGQNAGAENMQYTDPNAGSTYSQYTDGNAGHGQNYNNGVNYQQQYQDNYNYNVGNNTGYNQDYNEGFDTSPMSMGDWVLTLLLMSVPCLNIIFCCIWAFGKSGNLNRRNFCRAQLIFIVIGIVIGIIASVIIAFVGFSSINSISGSGYYYY